VGRYYVSLNGHCAITDAVSAAAAREWYIGTYSFDSVWIPSIVVSTEECGDDPFDWASDPDTDDE
jgi:hypothetical protein